MTPEEVEALLRQYEPAPPEDRLEVAVLERVGRVCPKPEARWPKVFAVAASILFAGIVFWAIFAPPRTDVANRPADEKKILDLVSRLGAEDPTAREQATEELKKMSPRILAILRRELGKASDAEVRARLSAVIEHLAHPSFERVGEIPLEYAWRPARGAWRPDGRHFAAGDPMGLDLNVARIYDASTWEETARVETASLVGNLTYSPDGRWLAAQTGGTIEFFSTGDYRKSGVSLASNGQAFRFIDSGRLVLTAPGQPSRLLLAFLNNGKTREIVTLDSDPSKLVFAISPDGAFLALYQSPVEIAVLDTASWTKVAVCSTGETERWWKARSLAFSPDGTLLAAQGSGDAIHVFDTAQWSHLAGWECAAITAFGFSSDSQHLLTAGDDGMLRAWARRGWKEAASVKFGDGALGVYPSPAGDQVVVFEAEESSRKLLVYRLVVPE